MRIPELLENYPSLHGTGGYQTLEYEPFDENIKVLFAAWKELGLKEVNYNSGESIGISRQQHATVNGSRQSSNGAYIRPIRGKRKNLFVRPNTWVTKVIIHLESKRAIGVEYRSGKSAATKKMFAREVILSAGTIDSPKLLMLSGVGPADNLEGSGIKVVHDLPLVGKNLHNHYSVPTGMRVEINHEIEPFDLAEALRDDTKAWLEGDHNTAISRFTDADAVVFLRTSANQEMPETVPDLKVMIVKYKRDGFRTIEGAWPYYDGYTLIGTFLAPKSRGFLKLDSKDPLNNRPLIYHNYFSDPRDISIVLEGSRLINRIVNTTTFKKTGYIITRDIPPDCAHLELESIPYFECVSANYAIFNAHLVGTCKMGLESDPTSVVDSRLRVRGIKGLRVIDASVMPLIPKGDTYAPAVVIGERASDFIKEDWDRLESANKT